MQENREEHLIKTLPLGSGHKNPDQGLAMQRSADAVIRIIPCLRSIWHGSRVDWQAPEAIAAAIVGASSNRKELAAVRPAIERACAYLAAAGRSDLAAYRAFAGEWTVRQVCRMDRISRLLWSKTATTPATDNDAVRAVEMCVTKRNSGGLPLEMDPRLAPEGFAVDARQCEGSLGSAYVTTPSGDLYEYTPDVRILWRVRTAAPITAREAVIGASLGRLASLSMTAMDLDTFFPRTPEDAARDLARALRDAGADRAAEFVEHSRETFLAPNAERRTAPPRRPMRI